MIHVATMKFRGQVGDRSAQAGTTANQRNTPVKKDREWDKRKGRARRGGSTGKSICRRT